MRNFDAARRGGTLSEPHSQSGERPVRSYRDLDVWNVGVELAVACYALTQQFPSEEKFGLTSQIRRAASSIPANVAEGYGRESGQEFMRFCRVAQGSTKELETHLIVATRVGVANPDDVDVVLEECDRVGRMLRGLIRALQERSP